MPLLCGLARELDRVFQRRDALEEEIREAFLDGSAFASGAKLAAYAGLAPVTRRSCTSLNAETLLTARSPWAG